MGIAQRVSIVHRVGHDDKRATRQGKTDAVRIGQADSGVCCHDPDGLDFTTFDGAEHINRLVSLARFQNIGFPEAADPINVVNIVRVHVGGKLVGKAANLAPAHGVWLAGDGKRA